MRKNERRDDEKHGAEKHGVAQRGVERTSRLMTTPTESDLFFVWTS
jgi:hypothetical protein